MYVEQCVFMCLCVCVYRPEDFQGRRKVGNNPESEEKGVCLFGKPKFS